VRSLCPPCSIWLDGNANGSVRETSMSIAAMGFVPFDRELNWKTRFWPTLGKVSVFFDRSA